MITRRFLLKSATLAACSAAAHPWLNTMTFASVPGDNRLVVIVLRGAMDGLDAVQPYGDKGLRALRTGLSVGPQGGALVMNFGLIEAFPSAFFRLMLRVQTEVKARGGRLMLCGFSDYMKEAFDVMGEHVGIESVRAAVEISEDLGRHRDRIAELAAVGFDDVYLHFVGQEQERFIDAFGEQVLPTLRG